MKKGDELYPTNFDTKAEYKLANLMKHGYEITAKVENGVRVQRNTDDLIVLSNGEVFKKVIY